MPLRALKLTIVRDRGSIPRPPWDESDPAVHARRNADGSIWAYSYEDGSEQWMHVPGIASFRFGAGGDDAVVVPESGSTVDQALIEDTYHRAVLPVALQAHGREVLHASAVLSPDGVVAFCARSQTGKSTVAYGLHRRGYNVWADDTLVFDSTAEPVQAVPYPYRLRIREESADYFELEELRKHDTSSWTALEQAQDEPAPLACIFLLERDEQSGTVVETVRLKPADALAGVLEHAYWFRLDAERTRQMIGKYLTLATQVPVFRLRFRAALDHLPEMLDEVQSIVKAVAGER